MKITILGGLLIALALPVFAQKTTVSGRVTDKSGKEPLPGANIQLLDTYDGATSDADGRFRFETEETGQQTLRVTYLGFDTVLQKIELAGGILEFQFKLKESFNQLNVVVITAGAFEASDERKVTVLKPLDIVTTASAGGDTYGALKTLPGAQVSTGDESGLFVRGGTGSEAQTFIDGLLVRNPFFASTPDYASRGRFNPFLFKGTVFSTGGYSAQYGQAMSSALLLETQDLPERSAGTLSLSSVGVGIGEQKLWREKGRAVGGNVNYTNLAPYFLLVKQRPTFTHKPEFVGTEGFFRQKTRGAGMLKFYGYLNHGHVGFKTTAADGSKSAFDIKNGDVYTNLTWAGFVAEHWKLNLGTSVGLDRNEISTDYSTSGLRPDTFRMRSSLAQFRAVATRYFGTLTVLHFGGEHQRGTEAFENSRFGESRIEDNYSAAFAETDLYLGTRLAARLGARFENDSYLKKNNLAPRASLAYKLRRHDQVSFAWGHFYQKGDSLLRWKGQFQDAPGFQRAEHYILNYQVVAALRTLRAEAFYKKYTDLVTTRGGLGNDGKGHARGIEVFFRDKKTFRGVDYWLSYSWLDTKRRFQWYPLEVQPTYAASHVATLVAKKFFPKIKTSVGMTYSYATGRPYFNPNRPAAEFLADRTPNYQNLSLNASYLTKIRGAFTVVVLGVQNALGQEQIFGYRYSADGQSRSAVTPGARRFVFVGCFSSWGIDRRQEVLDKQ